MYLRDYLIDYSNQVLIGEVVACIKHKQACQRFLNDIAREGTEEFPFYFDEDKALRFLEWCTFFKVFGVNPLLLYVAAEIFGDLFRTWHINTFLFDTCLQPLFGNYFGSFMYAALFLSLIWLVGYILFKKQIYIKL